MASANIKSKDLIATEALCNIIGGDVMSVSWGIDDQENTAEIRIPKKRFHEFRQYNAGKKVWVKIKKNGVENIIFQGYLTGRYFGFSSDSEKVTVFCRGPRWHLRGDYIKGQLLQNSDGLYLPLTGIKCVFNERLENTAISPGNAELNKISIGTFTDVLPFSLFPRFSGSCKLFTINDMLYYIYVVGRLAHVPRVLDNCLTITSTGVGEYGELKPFQINVDCLNIVEAMNLVFMRGGLRWWCCPISEDQSEIRAFIAGPNTNISDGSISSEENETEKYFYLAAAPVGVTPSTAPILKLIQNTQNNVTTGRGQEDFADVKNIVHCYGARKIFQEDFILKPGWLENDWANLKNQGIVAIRRETRKKTATTWEQNKDIGRLWILDEDGSQAGETYDFQGLFGHITWAKRARILLGERPDEKNIGGVSVKNSEGNIEKIESNINILPTRIGIYIESDELPSEILNEGSQVIPSGLATELYITIAVQEDRALEKVQVSDSVNTSWGSGELGNENSFERRIGFDLEDEYETDNKNIDKEIQVKDRLEDFAARKLTELKNERLSASFSIPWITTSYKPGDRIHGIKGRDLWFVAQIIEVRFEFGETRRTELILEDMRLAES